MEDGTITTFLIKKDEVKVNHEFIFSTLTFWFFNTLYSDYIVIILV